MNAWRLNVSTWMNKHKQAEYRVATKWRQMGKSAFSTYLHHLSGCKFLVRRLIALPIISPASSAAQPTEDPSRRRQLVQSFLELSREWAEEKRSPEHQGAIVQSCRRMGDRLSKRLWRAQQVYKEAAKLSHLVEHGIREFWDLHAWEKKMVRDYRSQRGIVADLKSLLAAHAERPVQYPGAGVVLRIPSNPGV